MVDGKVIGKCVASSLMVDVEDSSVPEQVDAGHLLVHTVKTYGRPTKAKFDNNCLLTGKGEELSTVAEAEER